MLPPARAIEVPTTTADVRIISGACIVFGWSFIETTGSAAAEIDLYEGLPATGVAFAHIALSSGQSTRDLTATNGIELVRGLHGKLVSGSVRGSVWLVPAERYDEYLLATGDRTTYIGET